MAERQNKTKNKKSFRMGWKETKKERRGEVNREIRKYNLKGHRQRKKEGENKTEEISDKGERGKKERKIGTEVEIEEKAEGSNQEDIEGIY